MSDRSACSVLAVDEPLAGSAPFARAWLILEHPVSWGRDALTDSHLPTAVVDHVLGAQQDAPLRFLAARRSDRRGRRRRAAADRRAWLAVCDSESATTRQWVLTDPREILDLDLRALANGVAPDVGEPVAGPLEFVCTHGTRDACCAVRGRRRIDSAPEDVWECSHLGGHRFAATSLFLPSGRLYGRLGSWTAHGEPDPRHLRGPCYLPAPLQVAECTVRTRARIGADVVLRVTQTQAGESWIRTRVEASDGRWWTLECTWTMMDTPASCGAEPEPRRTWRAMITREGT